ncbi:hypothetical protein ACQUSR_33855 [Streptomyces sp. P1-3]|uniref:hypothetical protein n=1 Tax=Streptomyces sp. P1-3 TaxID=3421658 RepID=UPI003D3670A2
MECQQPLDPHGVTNMVVGTNGQIQKFVYVHDRSGPSGVRQLPTDYQLPPATPI